MHFGGTKTEQIYKNFDTIYIKINLGIIFPAKKYSLKRLYFHKLGASSIYCLMLLCHRISIKLTDVVDLLARRFCGIG